MISLMTKWFIAGKASDFASGVIIQVEVLIMCLPVAYYFFMVTCITSSYLEEWAVVDNF